MGKSINEKSHKAIGAYLKHRGIEVLEENWAHGSNGIDFITMDDAEFVFVDTATKYGGVTTCPRRIPIRSASSASRRPISLSRPHQHPLRHRELPGDGFRGKPSASPQERPQRREVGPQAFAPGLQAWGKASAVILLYAAYPRLISFDKVGG